MNNEINKRTYNFLKKKLIKNKKSRKYCQKINFTAQKIKLYFSLDSVIWIK